MGGKSDLGMRLIRMGGKSDLGMRLIRMGGESDLGMRLCILTIWPSFCPPSSSER